MGKSDEVCNCAVFLVKTLFSAVSGNQASLRLIWLWMEEGGGGQDVL